MLLGFLICVAVIVWILRAAIRANTARSVSAPSVAASPQTEDAPLKKRLRAPRRTKRQPNPAAHYYRTELRGVTHENEYGPNRQELIEALRRGEELKLVPEPENLFDKDAVRVLKLDGSQVGYLPAHSQVADLLGRGWAIRAFVVSKFGLRNGETGVRIEIESAPPSAGPG